MTLVILCVAAFAAVAYGISATLFLGLRALQQQISRLAPVAQARLYLYAALLPLLVGAASLTAVLAPSFGWLADHCSVHGHPHLHTHICAAHHSPVLPAVTIVALACLMGFRLVLVVARRLYAVALGQHTRRTLDRIASKSEPLGVEILPLQHAQAFVLGLFRPKLYVTQGAVSGAESQHLTAVLAHERAHISRLDPLRRFVAGIGLGFHLPWVAGWLDRRLARAHEMVADELAAESVGCRDSVAEALVAFAKSQIAPPATAVAFSGSEIEARVARLLDPQHGTNQPSRLTLISLGVFLLVAIAASAETIHHSIESLFGVFGT